MDEIYMIAIKITTDFFISFLLIVQLDLCDVDINAIDQDGKTKKEYLEIRESRTFDKEQEYRKCTSEGYDECTNGCASLVGVALIVAHRCVYFKLRIHYIQLRAIEHMSKIDKSESDDEGQRVDKA